MSSFIKKNRLLFILMGVFVLFALAESFAAKGRLVLILNDLHSPATTSFFKYYTHAGAGITFILISVFLLVFVKIRWGIIGLASFSVSSLVSQFFKRVVFGPMHRPHKYFEGKESLNPIEGMDIAYLYSFPSGHSITAFALFGLLAFILHRYKGWVVVCFAAAVLAGISRIYLAQHFIEDVLAGGIIGFVTSWLLFYWLDEKRPGWLQREKLDKPLVKV